MVTAFQVTSIRDEVINEMQVTIDKPDFPAGDLRVIAAASAVAACSRDKETLVLTGLTEAQADLLKEDGFFSPVASKIASSGLSGEGVGSVETMAACLMPQSPIAPGQYSVCFNCGYSAQREIISQRLLKGFDLKIA